MNKRERGIIPYRYTVKREDGRDYPGGKHDGCFYWVLDIDHDLFARKALRTYIAACRTEYPKLAEDLTNELSRVERG